MFTTYRNLSKAAGAISSGISSAASSVANIARRASNAASTASSAAALAARKSTSALDSLDDVVNVSRKSLNAVDDFGFLAANRGARGAASMSDSQTASVLNVSAVKPKTFAENVEAARSMKRTIDGAASQLQLDQLDEFVIPKRAKIIPSVTDITAAPSVPAPKKPPAGSLAAGPSTAPKYVEPPSVPNASKLSAGGGGGSGGAAAGGGKPPGSVIDADLVGEVSKATKKPRSWRPGKMATALGSLGAAGAGVANAVSIAQSIAELSKNNDNNNNNSGAPINLVINNNPPDSSPPAAPPAPADPPANNKPKAPEQPPQTSSVPVYIQPDAPDVLAPEEELTPDQQRFRPNRKRKNNDQ